VNRLADEVHYCHICQMIADADTCSICADRTRDARTICVVESVRDVMSIEATGQYRGVYHVLGGIISPIDGIGPSDIHIRELVERIGRMKGEDIEIILALSGDVEGETTSLYIYRQIEGLGVKVSTLARGLGFGDDLEYADALTLGRSITGRQPFRP
jgi:recombination protein RecR